MQTSTSSRISQRTQISSGALALAFLAGLLITLPAFGQGTVQFNTRLTLGFPPYYTQVFMPEPDIMQKTGNTTANLPAGTQVYGGAPLTGSGWTAQLFAIPGNTLPAGPFTPWGVPINDQFVPAFPTTTFRTGAAAGCVALTTVTLPNVAPDAYSAVIQMRVFPSSFGSWAEAVAGIGSQRVSALGASPAAIVGPIGGSYYTPPQMTTMSFSLIPFPEPTSQVILLMGIAWLAFARRRHKRRPDV